jgi:hypothetical protein
MLDCSWGEILIENEEFDSGLVQSFLNTPEMDKNLRFSVNTESWNQMIEYCGLFSSDLDFGINNNLFTIRPCLKTLLTKIEIKMPIKYTEEPIRNVTFSAKLLRLAIQGPSEMLFLNLQNEMPLLVEYPLKFGANLRFFLAPLE